MRVPQINLASHARKIRPRPSLTVLQGAAAASPASEAAKGTSRSQTSSDDNQQHNHLRKPKLGFMGTGWIGRLRMKALQQENLATFAALYDPAQDQVEQAAALAPEARVVDSLEELLQLDLDGVVIATPSALHAVQSIKALEQGKAVFCQKPLARTAEEVERVLAAAQLSDRLLAVDFCYRHLNGMQQIRHAIHNGELGDVFAIDLVFHNAYGPDKPWFYDMQSSGGGCVMDLGIHLVDLAFWLLGGGEVHQLRSQLFHQGQRLKPPHHQVEDYATADFLLDDTQVRLACSWNLSAGQDAVIEARIHGSKGGAAIYNVNGSFFDFRVERYQGTQRHVLAEPPDDWGGRALCHWTRRLAQAHWYDARIASVLEVARTIDRIYQR